MRQDPSKNRSGALLYAAISFALFFTKDFLREKTYQGSCREIKDHIQGEDGDDPDSGVLYPGSKDLLREMIEGQSRDIDEDQRYDPSEVP